MKKRIIILPILFLPHLQVMAKENNTASVNCEVIILGGSLSAIPAALVSSRSGLTTCLLEPTDWPGGQMTNEGVPAIDFAWHSVATMDLKKITHSYKNIAWEIDTWLENISRDPDNCWVSSHCFSPKEMVEKFIKPTLEQETDLKVFYNTVPKKINVTSNGELHEIISVDAIQRKAGKSNIPQNLLLSEQWNDWYSIKDSDIFQKKIIKFNSQGNQQLIIIDASTWGEGLVLSGASFLQGAEAEEGVLNKKYSRCTQAATFPFVATLQKYPLLTNLKVSEQEAFSAEGELSLGRHTWESMWRYRRIKKGQDDYLYDKSLQNWHYGNDYSENSLFLSYKDTIAQKQNWQGGLSIKDLAKAEKKAFKWYYWLKENKPATIPGYITLDKIELGTSHGLSKFPYIRDTRRSIGIDDFILKNNHLLGKNNDQTGTRFHDRVGIGAYAIDFHFLDTCNYPDVLVNFPEENSVSVKPFYLPYRAFTNKDITNLLVSGKTMAQSFIANASSRVHLTEWSSGIAAGAIAAHLSSHKLTTSQGYKEITEIRNRIKQYGPVDWELPPPPLKDPDYICPLGTFLDKKSGFCSNDEYLFGPFPHKMNLLCEERGGGSGCKATSLVNIEKKKIKLPLIKKSFGLWNRGDDICPNGTQWDQEIERCVEVTESGENFVYGGFHQSLMPSCLKKATHKETCYLSRWPRKLYNALQ